MQDLFELKHTKIQQLLKSASWKLITQQIWILDATQDSWKKHTIIRKAMTYYRGTLYYSMHGYSVSSNSRQQLTSNSIPQHDYNSICSVANRNNT